MRKSLQLLRRRSLGFRCWSGWRCGRPSSPLLAPPRLSSRKHIPSGFLASDRSAAAGEAPSGSAARRRVRLPGRSFHQTSKHTHTNKQANTQVNKQTNKQTTHAQSFHQSKKVSRSIVSPINNLGFTLSSPGLALNNLGFTPLRVAVGPAGRDPPPATRPLAGAAGRPPVWRAAGRPPLRA